MITGAVYREECFYFQHPPPRCFIVGECYGSDMEIKEGRPKIKRRKVMWYGKDGLSMGHTEVIDFPQQEKEKKDLPG